MNKVTECVDYNALKQHHKQIREEALNYFREKAVGQNLKDFEIKILEEIQKKYLIVKQKCLQIYESKCIQSIKTELDLIDSNIRQDTYQTVQDFH